ncbi:MAG: hypothetical protein RMJ28_03665 [Nitrososphaerota archaeon]|nr:hypothetical protein [Candidatus Calditenuaceae archaeon]MDW8073318.1 hypothetical protein [Nitrososphaerota archaeon]
MRRRLQIRLSNSYEAVLKLLLFAKQGRLSLSEAHLKADGGGILVEMVIEGPPEKINWFLQKACGSPFIYECRSLE